MDIFDILGVNTAVKMRGEVTQERAQMAQSVWDAGVSLINVGLVAAKTFGRDIPDSLGEELKTAIETLDGTMTRYLDNRVDATAMKTAIRQAQGRVAQFSESLRSRPGNQIN
jgi:hypothetical protein